MWFSLCDDDLIILCPALRLRLARPSSVQVATAQRRVRAVAPQHQQHDGRCWRTPPLHASSPPRAHHTRARGPHASGEHRHSQTKNPRNK